MNDKQKIFVMVGVGSIIIFPLSVVANAHFNFSDFTSMFGGLKYVGDNLTGTSNWLGIVAVFNVVDSTL